MTYSYTQISQYLTCPRRYKHRYLDGWKEKDTRAAMLFGRAFEQALGALFRREDRSQAGTEGPGALRLCNLVAQSPNDAEGAVQAEGREGTDWEGNGTVGDCLLQTVPEPDASH